MKYVIKSLLVVGVILSFWACGNKSTVVEEQGSLNNPSVVKILMKDMNPQLEDIQLFEVTLEQNLEKQGLYVDIQILDSPVGRYQEVVPLAVRTGQITPDLVYFQGGDIPLSNEGFLTDLTPFLENAKYIPNIMQEHNRDRLENYPYMIWLSPARVSVPVIRKDIFEQLSTGEALMAEPTLENYYNFFVELKSKFDMSFTADSIQRMDSVFDSAFGITSSIVKEGGSWVYSQVSNNTREKLNFYARLFDAGLMDNEIFTNTWDVAEAKFYEGKSGVIIGTAGAVINIYNNKIVGLYGDQAELVVLPPAKGVAFHYASVDTSKETRGWAIHSGSQVKEVAFALLDYMASPEGRMIDLIGLEGMHYNITDSEIIKTEASLSWWPKVWESVYNFTPEYSLSEPVLSVAGSDSLEKISTYYASDNNILLPDTYITNFDSMMVIYTDYLADIIRGKKTTDSFDSFVKEWNDNGGTIISEYLKTVME